MLLLLALLAGQADAQPAPVPTRTRIVITNDDLVPRQTWTPEPTLPPVAWVEPTIAPTPPPQPTYAFQNPDVASPDVAAAERMIPTLLLAIGIPIGWILAALWGYRRATANGYHPGIALLGAFLLGPLAPLMGAVRPRGKRKCPSCAEWVSDEATVCRFCRSPLP